MENRYAIHHFLVGMRVELHPATDAWIFGDRYGDVVKVGRELVHVKMDRSGKVRKVHPRNIGWAGASLDRRLTGQVGARVSGPFPSWLRQA